MRRNSTAVATERVCATEDSRMSRCTRKLRGGGGVGLGPAWEEGRHVPGCSKGGVLVPKVWGYTAHRQLKCAE